MEFETDKPYVIIKFVAYIVENVWSEMNANTHQNWELLCVLTKKYFGLRQTISTIFKMHYKKHKI